MRMISRIVTLDRPARWHGFILQPGDWRVTFERIDPARTDEQNRYYWAFLNEFSDYSGTDSDDLHNFFKDKFLTDRASGLTASTTDLCVSAFADYLDKIAAFAAQYGFRFDNLNNKEL